VNSAYRGEVSRAGWTTEADFLEGQRVDPEALREIILTPQNIILCLALDQKILACTHLCPRGDDGVLLGMLSVTPELQNQGIGASLIAKAEEIAISHFQARKMVMKVLSLRPELIAYYERKNYLRKDEREAFPYGNERFGMPKRDDLEFIKLEKTLT
jgi:GNAT superfamily N-acetyltransferase